MSEKIKQIAFEVTGWIGQQNDGYDSDNYTGGNIESTLYCLTESGKIYCRNADGELEQIAIKFKEQP